MFTMIRKRLLSRLAILAVMVASLAVVAPSPARAARPGEGGNCPPGYIETTCYLVQCYYWGELVCWFYPYSCCAEYN